MKIFVGAWQKELGGESDLWPTAGCRDHCCPAWGLSEHHRGQRCSPVPARESVTKPLSVRDPTVGSFCLMLLTTEESDCI